MTSKFGDERLFFSHVKTSVDVNLWDDDLKKEMRGDDAPEPGDKPVRTWDTSVWPTDDAEEAEEKFMETLSLYGCPFNWLFEAGNRTSPPL